MSIESKFLGPLENIPLASLVTNRNAARGTESAAALPKSFSPLSSASEVTLLEFSL